MKNSHLSSCLERLDYLKIVPSYQCDRGCSYCYNAALTQVARADAVRLRQSLDFVIAEARRPFVAEIIGGEPLQGTTALQTIEILRALHAAELCERTIVSTAVGSSQVLRDLLPLTDFLYFSVDITRSKDNRKRVSGRFLQRLVDRCKSAGTELCISVVLDGSETTGDLTWFLDEAVRLGVHNTCFGFISFSALDRQQTARYSAAFHTLYRAQCILGDRLRIGGDILETLDLQVSRRSRSHNCHCGETSIVLQPDGKLSPSICFEDSPSAAISFDDYVSAKATREAHLKKGKCGNCELWGPCQGGCMGAAFRVNGRINSIDTSTCGILRTTWKKLNTDLANSDAVEHGMDQVPWTR